MKFTLSWLKTHLETSASLAEIVDKLTMIGLEVERIEDLGKTLAPFTVARVISAEKHPNADKLQGVHGRHRRRRAGAGRMRRAQRARRHDGRVRAARRVSSRAPAWS